MSDYVEITFDPPRVCRTAKKSYWLSAEGEEDLQLPVTSTTLFHTEAPNTELINMALMPRFIAEDRGLIDSENRNDDVSSGMTRHDWFLLGATMAFLARGETPTDAVWEGEKLAAKLEEVRD